MLSKLTTRVVHYSMATGGWSAPQYLYMFRKSLLFNPRVVIVAFYTGNDPLESFSLAYGSPHWSSLIPNKSLSPGDVPDFKWSWPPKGDEAIPVKFSDGVTTVFTPGVRLMSNMDHAVITAGYQTIKKVAEIITKEAIASDILPVFTVIPTKELVYSEKVTHEGIHISRDYDLLVRAESKHISDLENSIKINKGAYYIDLVTPLQHAAMGDIKLYPEDSNGHPVGTGYEVIGKTIAQEINAMLPEMPLDGFVGVLQGDNQVEAFLLRDGVAFQFPSQELVSKNGWKSPRGNIVDKRDLATCPKKLVDTIDREKYGPR